MRDNEERLSAEFKAYVAARLVHAVDMYFPHPIDQEDISSGRRLRALIKDCLAVESRDAFYTVCQSFMASFSNGHTEFYDRQLFEEKAAPIGFHAAPIDGHWLVSKSRNADIQKGDEITQIDGQAIDTFFQQQKGMISASTLPYAEQCLFFHPLLFPMRFTVTLAMGRTVAIERGACGPAAPRFRSARKQDGIAIFSIASFDGTELDAMLNELKACAPFTRLLLDLRGNCGGDTPIDLLRYLVPKRFRLWSSASVYHVGLEQAHASNAARMQKSPPLAAGKSPRPQMSFDADWFEGDGENAFAGPIVILQDALTTSAAEDFIHALRLAERATLVGACTSGSSGQPYFEDLGHGLHFRVQAKAECFANGSAFEGIGISPDYAVHPTAQSLKEGSDPVFDEGLRILKQL